MDGKSLNISANRLNQLMELYPEVFSEGKINWEKFQNILGEKVNLSDERYHLNWAGKSDCFKVIQEPTTATLKPCKDESINWDTTENIFIEGENLEVLKVLQKSYYGKIKMIYIDPPYNTGNDSFIYPDKFSETKEDYKKRAGEMNEEGYLTKEGFFRKNSKDSGRFHSNWLSMMYPRLFLARNLLKDDGVIFVSIDDNEVHNLRMIMNEIYGEENLAQEIIWQRHSGGGNDSRYFAVDHEYILCYARNKQSINRFRVPLSEEDKKEYKLTDQYLDTLGPYKTKSFYRMRPDDPRPGLQYNIKAPDGEKLFGEWKWEEQVFLKAYKEEKVIIRKDSNDKWIVEYKIYLNESTGIERLKVPRSLFLTEARNSQGKGELTRDLGRPNIFNNPKPIALIRHLINIAFESGSNEIVMDFFAGSCSTAAAVIELNNLDGGNRKSIMIQLPEKTLVDSEAFKNKFDNIATIGKKRIKNVIKRISSGKSDSFNKIDIGLKIFKLSKSNFKQWQLYSDDSLDALNHQIDLFVQPLGKEVNHSNIILEIIIKSGYSLNCKIEEIKIKKTRFFRVENVDSPGNVEKKGIMLIVLDAIDEHSIKLFIKEKPGKIICFDSIFNNKDKFKTNLAFQLKDSKIEFITI